jgi:hypothetical protein
MDSKGQLLYRIREHMRFMIFPDDKYRVMPVERLHRILPQSLSPYLFAYLLCTISPLVTNTCIDAVP